MSTTPRIYPPAPNTPAEFGSVMQHTPATIGAFFDLYAHFWQQGQVAADIKEMTRLRNARITDCGY